MPPNTHSNYEQFKLTLREKVQINVNNMMTRLGRTHFTADDFAIVPLVVSVAHLDPLFEGFRIVHISDLHMGHWLNGERLQGVAQLINAQAPDVVAITGDFVSYSIDQIAADLVNGLSRLKPREATAVVLGNHDHWLDVVAVRRLLQQSGVVELANDVLTLHRGNATLHFAGVDDIIVGADRLDEVMQKLPPDGPAVLLAHEPDFADESASNGRFFLQLSGHSHGGQIYFPKLGPLRGSHFRKYPLGRYQVGNMVQYTNRGIGTHILRLRINCKPEITVITLTSAP